MPKKMLTASEIGILWTQYVQNSMALPILEYFQQTTEDKDIKPLITLAKEIAEKGLENCKHFFEEADLPVPHGYSLDDLNPNAPKLFTDSFMLVFLEHMGQVGLTSDGVSLSVSAREDIREFFTAKVKQQSQLYNGCVNTALNKGLYTRSPQVAIQQPLEYVQGKSYLHPFNKRSLNTIEITHLFENVKNNALGEIVCQAFGQTTKNKTVKNFMQKGKKLSIKHRKLFANILDQSGITVPMTSASWVTTKTDPVFSDRLMLYIISVLSSSGQGNYAGGASSSLRYDIVFTYQRLAIEIAIYAKDGMDIMINNGWFEEPPQAPDLQKLIQ
ncbi:DUF3231 family protein [Halobacillus litoralis]|uniref:DUF3231 family protein n=1 Tax=Halobacillus litoralis TaxID=45668 RepID=UPI001CFEEA9C|nr:DUF3231 family protein [Halobacillus litoralis]